MTQVHPRRAATPADSASGVRSWSHALREVALTTAAVIGVICILAAIAAIGFGIKPLVFRSGSMSPGIQTGALGLARTVSADQLAPGDVVSVTNSAGVRITHRIQELAQVGGAARLTLKGDANDISDAETYQVTEADRLFLSVNRLGYVVSWLSSTPAVFVGGALVGGLLVYAFRPRGRRVVALTTVVALGGSCALGLAAPRGWDTEAAWADAAGAGAVFSALTVPPPGTLSCTTVSVGTRGAKFTWPGAASQRYEITLKPLLSPAVVRDIPAGETSYLQSNALLGVGSATVRTFVESGGNRWYSSPSNAVGFATLAGLVAICA